MEVTNKPRSFYIIDKDGNNIFDANELPFSIPLYQRAFAWSEKELRQLLEDISESSGEYCIGSLIVSNQGNKFELIDGQQRLTSIYLLLNCLGLQVDKKLTFECRPKAEYTLENIKDLIDKKMLYLDSEKIECSIEEGVRIITDLLASKRFDKEKVEERLKHVSLYRIEVPKNTDLNRYFETMNTRGVQLEQHDILKAKLMSYLGDEVDKNAFANIWEACSDMTGYVQMHFRSKDNFLRKNIFGSDWNSMLVKAFESLNECFEKVTCQNEDNKKTIKITDIIKENFKVKSDEGYNEDNARIRFESIIDFPYFLLHTLKVFVATKNITDKDSKSEVIPELLDDKKLCETFDNVIKEGWYLNNSIKNNESRFAKDFIFCLLQTRFLFDKYIIKREFVDESSDGDWSLKSLYVSDKKPYYKNTFEAEKNNIDNIMLQSALRVSFTSPKVMHWITELLKFLIKNFDKENCAVNLGSEAEKIIQESVKENFLDIYKTNGKYEMGVMTPHIVFNYLDYLIWKKYPQEYKDFKFEFRNSVEHWYPQKPSEGSFERWSDGVDRFGNLCLVQRNINSKFSNLSPEAKESTYEKMISKGSLKLRIMSEITKNDKMNASLNWKTSLCDEHEKKMINLLKESLKENSALE